MHVDAGHSALVIRAAALYFPISLAWVAWVLRRPGPREKAAMLLASVWTLSALLFIQALAPQADWWSFEADGGVFWGIPVDLLLGWVVLWGVLPMLLFPRTSLYIVAAIFLLFDLAFMPLMAPVLRLSSSWLTGELVAIAIGFMPAQQLARWTRDDTHLERRVLLQIGAFSVTTMCLLPALVLEWTGGSFAPLFLLSSTELGLWAQLLAVPGVVGLSAVQEFVERGGGTPLPYDPPKRLVTSGLYGYVANPMQISAVLLLLGLGVLLGSLWVAAAGVMAHIYSLGIANVSERDDLADRFGSEWLDYRRHVQNWIPRFRPWRPPDRNATLYVAGGCEACESVRAWVEKRRPRGLVILPAQEHPSRDLNRITYVPAAGPEQEGIAAIARTLEHIHLAYAVAGSFMRLPLVRHFLQLVADASGAGPRRVQRASLSRPNGV